MTQGAASRCLYHISFKIAIGAEKNSRKSIFLNLYNLAKIGENISKNLRHHRTEIVRQMCSQIFRQIVQKFCRHTVVCQEIYVQDDGKYASR